MMVEAREERSRVMGLERALTCSTGLSTSSAQLAGMGRLSFGKGECFRVLEGEVGILFVEGVFVTCCIALIVANMSSVEREGGR